MNQLYLSFIAFACFISINAQDVIYYGDKGVDSESSIDNLYTERSYPDYLDKLKGLPPFAIVPCRKISNFTFSFPRMYLTKDTNTWKKLKNPVQIEYSKLIEEDKIHLYELVLNSKDPKYFNLLEKLVLTDTLKKDEEILGYLTTCLGVYNTKQCKKLFHSLLNDSTLNDIAVLALVQIGDYKTALDYFNHNYNYKENLSSVNSALMQINSIQSVDLLKKIASDPKAFAINSIDALAALSLLGYCDYAKQGFINLAKHNNFRIREKAVSCLAYYTGTPDAIEIIEKMLNDSNDEVKNEALKVLDYYFAQKKLNH